jgi:hypothetical protein
MARVPIDFGSAWTDWTSLQYTQLLVSPPDGAVFIIQRAIAGM